MQKKMNLEWAFDAALESQQQQLRVFLKPLVADRSSKINAVRLTPRQESRISAGSS
jgi:hypothetical protein